MLFGTFIAIKTSYIAYQTAFYAKTQLYNRVRWSIFVCSKILVVSLLHSQCRTLFVTWEIPALPVERWFVLIGQSLVPRLLWSPCFILTVSVCFSSLHAISFSYQCSEWCGAPICTQFPNYLKPHRNVSLMRRQTLRLIVWRILWCEFWNFPVLSLKHGASPQLTYRFKYLPAVLSSSTWQAKTFPKMY